MTRFDCFRLKNEMLVTNYLANAIGVSWVIFLAYHPVSPPAEAAVRLATQVGFVFEPLWFAVLLIVIIRFERPIRLFLSAKQRGESINHELSLQARKRLLNEPFFLIALDLAVWVIAAVLYSLVFWVSDVGYEGIYYTFFRSLQTGLITVIAAFFLLRSVLQKTLVPNLFPAGGLYTTPGTVRIRLSTRLAALLLACNLVPFFAVITILQGTFYANVIDPSIFEQLRSDLLRSSFVFMAIGVFLTLQLSLNLKRPFKDIIQALRAVRNGQFDQKVRVTSNDEIGYVGDVINEMTEGLIERDRMRHSLEVAKEVQQNFIPKTEPNVSGLDIAGKSIYCERTGGDYYDYLPLPDSQNVKIGIVIGDVTGHGIPAALLMATVRSSLRQRILLPGGIGRIISDVNRQLTSDVEDSGRFMTLFYSEIDSENRSIQWVRAGHDPAIFYDPQIDAFEELKGPGIALGVDECWKYAVNRKDDLKDNQIIVLCTDGVWEAHNTSGEMFGKDALYDIIRRNADLPASDIVEAVITALNEFQSGLEREDDVTLVVVKIT